MKASFILAAALAAASAPAFAQAPMTGNAFEAVFAGSPEDRMLYLAAIAKKVDEESQSASTHFICAPPGATYWQAAKVIDAYERNYPQYLNYPMHDIAATALMLAFPCQ